MTVDINGNNRNEIVTSERIDEENENENEKEHASANGNASFSKKYVKMINPCKTNNKQQ